MYSSNNSSIQSLNNGNLSGIHSNRIEFGLTNDYMFKSVFQNNENALRNLLCAILHLDPNDILQCEVTNPIILGETVNSKTCILDIRVRLNNNTNINMEMQVGNLTNWSHRSLYYTCDMYVDLKRGEDYSAAEPCIQIGFVSHSPFHDRQRFISRYFLTDNKDHHIFTSDFQIIMIDLSQINECDSELDQSVQEWAKLFLATDWSQAEELAKNSQAMQEVVSAMKTYASDEKIHEQCLARILYEGDMSSARKEGIEEGRIEGRIEGRTQALHIVNQLHHLLLQDERFDDLKRSCIDPVFQEQLFKEYGL